MDIDVSRLDGGDTAFERLCSDLLIRLYPTIKPLDGSGGDGGVDSFNGKLLGSVSVFQYKYFPGRIDNGRKKQILNSLATAISKNPGMKEWVIMLPLNFTPEEQKWFEVEIIAKNPNLKIDYWGQQRLEDEITKNKEIRKRYFPTSNMAVMEKIDTAFPWMSAPPVERLLSHADEMKKIQDDNPHLGLTYGVSPGLTNLTFNPTQPIEFSLILKSKNKLNGVKTHAELMERLKNGEITLGKEEIVDVKFRNNDIGGLPPGWNISGVQIFDPKQGKKQIILEIPNTGILFQNSTAMPVSNDPKDGISVEGLPFGLLITPQKDGKTLTFSFNAELDGKPIFEVKRIIDTFDAFANNGIIIRDNQGQPLLANGKLIGQINDPFPPFLRDVVARLHSIEQKVHVNFNFNGDISEDDYDRIMFVSDLLSTGKHTVSVNDLKFSLKTDGLDSSKLLNGPLEKMAMKRINFGVMVLSKSIPLGDVLYEFPTLKIENMDDLLVQLKSKPDTINVVCKPIIDGSMLNVSLVK